MRLETLKREFIPMMYAEDPHFLMRAQEVKNIMDLTAVHIEACIERKESRGQFLRLDFPDRDPSRDDVVTYQRMENGEAVMEFRTPPDLKPEYGEVK
jgi:succinate dehydrogenase/fumarate reductase flavoprotein subunit